jgi:uncharacterized protein (DUF1778 family)
MVRDRIWRTQRRQHHPGRRPRRQRGASTELAMQADTLRTEVDRFIAKVRAAWFQVRIAERNTSDYIADMPRVAKRSEYPLSMRMPAADIAVIDRAATLRGRSRTDFIREAAVRAAEQEIVESTLIRLSPAAFKELMATISAPGKPVPEMVEFLKRRAPWEST